jgi:hypothetical protein
MIARISRNRSIVRRRATSLVPLALTGALLAPAIGWAVAGVHAGNARVATPNVIVNTSKGTLHLPGRLVAGLVRFQLKDGAQPGSVMLGRLNPGVTPAKFEAALQKDQNAAFGLVTFVGGAESNAQASAAVTVKLTAGQYVSAIQTAAPQPSLSFFTVQPGQGAATPPAATATVREIDSHGRMGYAMPNVLPAGRDILEVINTGDSPHEFQLARLHAGKSLQDLEAYFATGMKGPAPADMVGGLPPHAANGTNWLETTLKTGTYVAVCSMQDTPTSKPHFMLGMLKVFTVR